MRNLTSEMQAHIESEVTSLVMCLEIIRNDGVVLRMTEFNRDLTVGGVVYKSGCTFKMSAVKSSSDLSVDNATMDVGIDGTTLTKNDFQRDLMKRAKVYVFSVNWQAPDDGTIDLKRGWLGDVTLRDENWVTLAIRGLTQALQRNILEQYSPTCRAEFGDKRCGMAINPFLRRHRQGMVYKTGDWVVVPTVVTNVFFGNPSFESNGNVNETDPITAWTRGVGAKWSVQSAIAGSNGTYSLLAGTPTGAAGFVNSISQTMSATVAGMSASQIDLGAYMLAVDVALSSPSATGDSARVVLTTYDNQMKVMQVAASDWEVGEQNLWRDLSVGLIPRPGVRFFTVTLEARKSTGAIAVMYDNVRVSYFSTTLSAINSVVYKSVRIPGRVVEDAVPPTNFRFAANGLVSNGGTITGWTNANFTVVANASGLNPYDGAYFALAGDNGTTTPAQIYTVEQTVDFSTHITDANVTAGLYLFEVNIQRAHLSTGHESKAVVTFLDGAGATLSSVDSGYSAPDTTGVWSLLRVSGKLPTGTKKYKITLYAKTAADSVGRVAFGGVYPYLYNTALSQTNDNTTGRSATVRPTFDATPGAFTYDGDLVWQAMTAPFGFDQVDNVTDRRVFNGLNITGSQFSYFAARITWLSGANAGTDSYVRTWVSGTKTLKLYTPLGANIQIGDKFMYSQGCNKTISDCSTRFNNAINFRGEPYLPGQEKALQFFGATNA